MNSCPLCSQKILRHIRPNQIYWYCVSCRQEMPNLGETRVSQVKRGALPTCARGLVSTLKNL